MGKILILSLISLYSCAPQYGGGGNSLPVKAPAPVQSSPQVSCRTEYTEVWDTKYVETETQSCQTIQVKQCNTAYKKRCTPTLRQECQTVYKPVCKTEYQQQCSQKYRDETEYYTETECKTEYKEDCEYQWEGTGNNKVWAPIRGTCKNNPYDTCGDVQKERLKQVPYQDCQNVPQQQCKAVHKKVPKRVSRRVPKQVCDDGANYGSLGKE